MLSTQPVVPRLQDVVRSSVPADLRLEPNTPQNLITPSVPKQVVSERLCEVACTGPAQTITAPPGLVEPRQYTVASEGF